MKKVKKAQGGKKLQYVGQRLFNPSIREVDTTGYAAGKKKYPAREIRQHRPEKQRSVRRGDIKHAINWGMTLNEEGGKVTKAKEGKWIQKATASIKRRGTEGKCTPITKPGCTGRAKALAKTFKKIAKSRKK